MMKKFKTVPSAMAVVSFLYFLYVVSSGNTKMIGDEIGGDPGGMILPLALSIFMTLGFAYIAIKERPDGRDMVEGKTRKLFLITLMSALLYVVLHASLGFVLTSFFLVYLLTVSYLSIDLDSMHVGKVMVGGISSLAYSLIVYSGFRYMTRILLKNGRNGTIPSVFGNPNLTAFLSMIVVCVFVLAAIGFFHRRERSEEDRIVFNGGIISCSATMFLYIIFKQFFLISMAQGIIRW